MRLVSIAMFLLCIQVAIGFVNATAIFDISFQADNSLINSVNATTIQNSDYTQSQVQASQNFGFGDFVKAMFFFVTTFATSVFAFPVVLHQFGVPWVFAIIVSAPIYSVYLFALAQFLGNRSEKSMG